MKIKTDKGDYFYNKQELFHGRKFIDIDIATKNLIEFKSILDFNSIYFGIIFGTLLGAIRENNFIAHDEDVDVFILEEEKQNFLNLLFLLREVGFEVARYEGKILSLIRNDNYIDIYFFKKNLFGERTCGGYTLKSHLLEEPIEIEFLGCKFKGPKDPIAFLELFYGKDWEIPKEGAHATNFNIKFRSVIKKILPKCIIKMIKK